MYRLIGRSGHRTIIGIGTAEESRRNAVWSPAPDRWILQRIGKKETDLGWFGQIESIAKKKTMKPFLQNEKEQGCKMIRNPKRRSYNPELENRKKTIWKRKRKPGQGKDRDNSPARNRITGTIRTGKWKHLAGNTVLNHLYNHKLITIVGLVRLVRLVRRNVGRARIRTAPCPDKESSKYDL